MNDNKKFWDRAAFLYERVQNKGKNAKQFYEILKQKIVSELDSEMDVLELAMGPAMLTSEIAKSCKTLHATDFSEKMVLEAGKKKLPENVIVEQADATALTYENESFDAVIIANALHIMPDPEKAVKEIKRVLRKDGILIAPTYTLAAQKGKLKMKLMTAVGFVTYFPWDDKAYQEFLKEQGLVITNSEIITCSDFPESFVVCKKQE